MVNNLIEAILVTIIELLSESEDPLKALLTLKLGAFIGLVAFIALKLTINFIHEVKESGL